MIICNNLTLIIWTYLSLFWFFELFDLFELFYLFDLYWLFEKKLIIWWLFETDYLSLFDNDYL